MTLSELMQHFFHLYGRRNRIYLTSLEERHRLLALAISDLHHAIRKEHSAKVLDIALARIVSRIFCVAEHFWSLPLVECLARKYPLGRCSYCQQLPCVCSEKRPDPHIEAAACAEQLPWSLGQWSIHLDALYGPNNKQKGIENITSRLFRELGEMLSVQMTMSHLSLSLDAIEELFAFELADVLAWTIAVANFLERDLEGAVLNRFGAGCWNCRQNPCVCRNFNFALIEWSELENSSE